jgi:iron complex outermembrane recepter protein
MFKNKKLLPGASIVALALSSASGAMAQDVPTDSERAAERASDDNIIIVTATRRSEGLQDVPIALSVVSGEFIGEQGIDDLEALSGLIPNVHVGKSGSSNQIFIRGIGSGNNQGFEQSVGMFVDGVYMGRARNSRAAFLDVERVEVLKGPQSTLFGKNTIAGAINITSGQPTNQLEGYVEANYETEVNAFGLTAVVSGPLSDRFRARIAANYLNSDGWMRNNAPNGEDGPGQENIALRGIFEWDATDTLTLNFKAEHGEFDIVGREQKLTISTPTSDFLFGLGSDPSFASTTGFNRNKSDAGFPGRPLLDNTKSNIFQMTADLEFGDHTLRSISAFTKYEYRNCTDADYAPVNFIDRCRNEEHKQFTQEILLTSPSGQTVEYLAGVYYQDADLRSDASTMVALSSLPPIENAILGLLGGGAPGSLDTEFLNFFRQKSETWSAFAELTFNLTDSFRVTGGLRYSDDSKNAVKQQITAVPGGTTSDPFLGFIMSSAVLGFANQYSYDLDRNENHWTGNLNLQYDFNDDIMAYFNFGTGYKAGGFDADNGLDRSREFEAETVTSFEAGLKMELLDRRARINLAAFINSYDDVQVSSFETVGFIVGNAAKTKVQGIEGDFVFAATDELSFHGAFSILDAKYDKFTNAACKISQIQDGSCAANGGFQDLSGQPLQFAPDTSGNIGFSYDKNITDGLVVSLGTDVLWTDDIVVAPDGDPNVIQSAYAKINARIGIEADDGSWSLAVVGKNLTNKTTFNWGNDASLSGTGFGFENAYFHHIQPPRTFELRARLAF